MMMMMADVQPAVSSAVQTAAVSTWTGYVTDITTAGITATNRTAVSFISTLTYLLVVSIHWPEKTANKGSSIVSSGGNGM